MQDDHLQDERITRRSLIGAAAAVTVGALAGCSSRFATEPTAGPAGDGPSGTQQDRHTSVQVDDVDDYSALDATALAELVRSHAVSPRELVEAAIVRAEATNPTINAIISATFEAALAAADAVDLTAPFAGVPFLLKDFGAEQAGQTLTLGNRALRDVGYRSPNDSEIGRRFRQAGLVTLGRTNVPEGGVQGTTQPLAYGPTRNPWALDRSVSGSSGGSAAAVAVGIVPMAHGNDGAGSIRVPAAWCGVVGLKPSRGRTPSPIAGFRRGVDFALTRSVRDAANLLDAVHGSRPGDEYLVPGPDRPFAGEVGADPGRLRIALCTSVPGVVLDPSCVTAVEETGRALEAAGHRVDAGAEPAHVHRSIDRQAQLTLGGWMFAGSASFIEHALGRRLTDDDVEPFLWAALHAGFDTSPAAVISSMQAEQHWANDVCRWWEAAPADVLVLPTAAAPPLPLSAFAPDPSNPLAPATPTEAMMALTSPFNVTGEPAISLPLGTTPDGLPVGVQLVAPIGGEATLLEVAAHLEQAMPWRDRRPPI